MENNPAEAVQSAAAEPTQPATSAPSAPAQTPAENAAPQAQPQAVAAETPKAPEPQAQGLLQAQPDPQGSASTDDQAKTQADTVNAGAPEKYEFTNPEGFERFDPTDANPMVGKFSEVAKELNLTNEQAQKIYSAMAPMIGNQPYEAVNRLRDEGAKAARNDPEYGGTNFQDNLKVAAQAYNDQRFVTPELRNLLQQTGLDSHPEMVRLFYRLGKQTGEGTFIKSDGTRPATHDFRNRYPNTNMNP